MRKAALSLFLLYTVSSAHGAAFDRIGVGARAKGMGDAFCAVADDVTAVYWNPAGLAKVKASGLSVMYRDLFGLGLIDYTYAGYAQPGFGKGAVGFTWIRLATSNSVDYLKYSENTYMFAYGFSLGGAFKAMSIGAGVKYYFVDYDQGKASGMGADVGLRIQAAKNLTIVAVGQDVNCPKIRYQTGYDDTMDPNYKLGLNFTNTFVNVSADLDQLKQPRPKLHLGLEKPLFRNTFFIRAGGYNVTESIWNITFGAGLKVSKAFALDYAFEMHPELGNSQVFSLNVKF